MISRTQSNVGKRRQLAVFRTINCREQLLSAHGCLERVLKTANCFRLLARLFSRIEFAPTCLLLLLASAQASDGLQGEIRFEAGRSDATWLGQELELNLDLWSDGVSFGDQSFVLPEVKGAYLLQADSSTVKLNESRDGDAWQGLRYTFLLYPQRAGRLEVPSFEVRFSARVGYDSEPAAFRFQTPVLFVEAQLPPGANASGLVVTSTSFTMESSWTPTLPDEGPGNLKVGDAITLEVTRSARDVPGMVFAPLPELSIEGLGIYPDAAQVNDRVNRGDLTGSRIDSVTFICEQDGNYEIPEMRFQWWDPEQEVLAEKVIPARELVVVANPAYAGSAATVSWSAGKWLSWKSVAAVMITILLLIFPGWWLVQFAAGRLPQLLAKLIDRLTRWVKHANVLQPLNPRSTRSP